MFEKVRQTRRGGQRSSHRKTVKAQRGGALFHTIDPTRLPDWREHLERLGLPLHASGAIVPPGDMVEEHFRILEKQDELLNAALQIIIAKLGEDIGHPIDTEDVIITQADAINRNRGLQEYIHDVEKLVNFVKDVVNFRPPHPVGGYTKLQDIDYGIQNNEFFMLLLYQKRLTNIFIDSLANIFITLKHSPDLQRQLAIPYGPEIAAVEWGGNVNANAYSQTARPLRDGFYLNQGRDNFQDELTNNNFWEVMAIEINRLLSRGAPVTSLFITDPAAAPAACRRNLGRATWGFIAAHIFMAYKLDVGKTSDPPNNILVLFADRCTTTPPLGPDGGHDRTNTPNQAYDDLRIRGTTYANICSYMDDPVLQFMLHLYYTIWKNEAGVLAELAS